LTSGHRPHSGAVTRGQSLEEWTQLTDETSETDVIVMIGVIVVGRSAPHRQHRRSIAPVGDDAPTPSASVDEAEAGLEAVVAAASHPGVVDVGVAVVAVPLVDVIDVGVA
jgi:hypothetical protein